MSISFLAVLDLTNRTPFEISIRTCMGYPGLFQHTNIIYILLQFCCNDSPHSLNIANVLCNDSVIFIVVSDLYLCHIFFKNLANSK